MPVKDHLIRERPKGAPENSPLFGCAHITEAPLVEFGEGPAVANVAALNGNDFPNRRICVVFWGLHTLGGPCLLFRLQRALEQAFCMPLDFSDITELLVAVVLHKPREFRSVSVQQLGKQPGVLTG